LVGIDHTSVLGKTLAEIAMHKAGIMKKSVPAFSSEQPKEASDVLEAQAKEIGASSLTFVNAGDEDEIVPAEVIVGLPGKHQRSNAALATLVVKEFLNQYKQRRGADFWPEQDETLITEACYEGVKNVTWPGRGQIIKQDGIEYLLDGAHTIDSIKACVGWVKDMGDQKGTGLIFNCTGGRNHRELLAPLAGMSVCGLFGRVVFCSNETYKTESYAEDLVNNSVEKDEGLTQQKSLRDEWCGLTGAGEDVKVVKSIEEALDVFRGDKDEGQKVLVCGSLHLLGGVLTLLGAEVV
jgi:folylpolyglutamate synthase